MKWLFLPVLFVLLCPAHVLAQKSTKTAAKAPTASSQRETLSTEEQNIRAYVELIRTDLRKGKAQVMSDVMALDAEQAAAFWPIYKEFEASYAKIGDDIVALVKNYAENYDKMTNDLADRLATKLLAIDQSRNELKKQYYQKFKYALEPITAARFLQVENQLEKLMDLQIASQLPVVSSQGK
jgi:hypothetical protein